MLSKMIKRRYKLKQDYRLMTNKKEKTNQLESINSLEKDIAESVEDENLKKLEDNLKPLRDSSSPSSMWSLKRKIVPKRKPVC